MRKVLITGANSFIGLNFIKHSKYQIIDQISLFDNNPGDIDFGKYDTVLHVAAIVHQSKSIPDEKYFCVNRDLCLDVAENARKAGIKQFIFLSTLKVYGEFISDSNLRNENSVCNPSDAYGKSKYEAELGLKRLEDSNFTVSIIRSSLVYGEGVKANMMRLIELVDHCPVLPFGNTDNKRNFIYIENLVRLIDKVIEKRVSGIFLAMDEKAISTRELVSYIATNLGKNVILINLPVIAKKLFNLLLPGIFGRLYASLEFDNRQTIKTLDLQFPVSTEEGIRRMVNSYQNCKKNIATSISH